MQRFIKVTPKQLMWDLPNKLQWLFVAIIFLLGKSAFSQDTLSYSNLSKEQYSSWKTIEDKWMNETFRPYLAKRKIKLSCNGCESVYISLVFKKDTINTTYQVIRTRKCGAPFPKLQMNEVKLLLEEIKLPQEFNNTLFKVNLGLVLKC